MSSKSNEIFKNEYMPYIIKWGKITTWGAVFLVYLPLIVVLLVYGARPQASQIFSAMITTFSTWAPWYIVDPVALFPILAIPGMYMTYIAGNSKEIRSPAALQAMAAAGVQGGTPEGTVVSALGIATSVLISAGVLTVFAIGSELVLAVLPDVVLKALRYLLPSLFGAMFAQRLLTSPKMLGLLAIILIIGVKFLNVNGIFKLLPLNGTYAPILICVAGCMYIAKKIAESTDKN